MEQEAGCAALAVILFCMAFPRQGGLYRLLLPWKCFLNIRTFLLTISRFHQLSPFNHILSFLLYFFNKNIIDERMRVSYLKTMIEQIIA
jgi:hypothetical protein